MPMTDTCIDYCLVQRECGYNADIEDKHCQLKSSILSSIQ